MAGGHHTGSGFFAWVARLAVALSFALCALVLAAGCGATVDLGGFRPADAGPDSDASAD